MAVPISPAHGRLRFGLGSGLTAAAQGLAFACPMLAGLGLLLIVLAALAFTVFGVAMLVVGNDTISAHRMLLNIVLLLAGPGLVRFALPAALLGLRRLARLARRLAGAWCGVPIAEAYQPRPAGLLTFTRRLSWLLGDRATWRDLLWTVMNGSRAGSWPRWPPSSSGSAWSHSPGPSSCTPFRGPRSAAIRPAR